MAPYTDMRSRNDGEHGPSIGSGTGRFIEEQFGKETADRLRRTLMTMFGGKTVPLCQARDRTMSATRRWPVGNSGSQGSTRKPRILHGPPN